MKIFIDSGNINEIRKFVEIGIVDGCTTNPKILSRDLQNPEEFLDKLVEIAEIVKGPVSIEVTSNDLEEMVKQAVEFSDFHRNFVIKLPALPEGYAALKILKEKYPWVRTNVTACYTAVQVFLASKLGSDFASIFYNRIKDIGGDPIKVIKDSLAILKSNNLDTQIIVGSIRKLDDVVEVAKTGVHIITIPTRILEQMVSFEPTKRTIEEFLRFWSKGKLLEKQERDLKK